MKDTLKALFATATVCTSVSVIFAYPEQIKSGVIQGLGMCAQIVIPSMFVFAVVSNFAAESGGAYYISKPLSFILSPMLKIPPDACCAVVMSFISGYAVGAAGVKRLYDAQIIDRATAERLLATCTNASPPMVIIAIGTGLLGNAAIGWIMYLSHIAASVLIGVVLARFAKKPNAKSHFSMRRKPLADAFVISTADACSQMLIICTYVVLFCAVGAVIGIGVPFMSAMLEVTSGAKWAADSGMSAPIIAAITAFGGISVICQVMSVAKGISSPTVIIFMRIANAAVTAAICTVALKLFSAQTEVMSNLGDSTAEFAIVTVPVTVSMLIMAATFLLTVRQKS